MLSSGYLGTWHWCTNVRACSPLYSAFLLDPLGMRESPCVLQVDAQNARAFCYPENHACVLVPLSVERKLPVIAAQYSRTRVLSSLSSMPCREPRCQGQAQGDGEHGRGRLLGLWRLRRFCRSRGRVCLVCSSSTNPFPAVLFSAMSSLHQLSTTCPRLYLWALFSSRLACCTAALFLLETCHQRSVLRSC